MGESGILKLFLHNWRTVIHLTKKEYSNEKGVNNEPGFGTVEFRVPVEDVGRDVH